MKLQIAEMPGRAPRRSSAAPRDGVSTEAQCSLAGRSYETFSLSRLPEKFG